MIVGGFGVAAAIALAAGPTPPLTSRHGDTTLAVVPQGDTAAIPLPRWFLGFRAPSGLWSLKGRRLVVPPTAAGRQTIPLRSFLGLKTHVVRVETFERRELALLLHPVGPSPVTWKDSSALSILQTELTALFHGTGICPSLALARPRALPTNPAFWDLDGDGHLDLARNADSTRPWPELDSLSAWVARQNLSFPDLVLLQAPVRVGWALARPAKRGDSLLWLEGRNALPWRDARGQAVRYVAQTRRGQSSDTFAVAGYEGRAVRVRTTNRQGTWGRDHRPETDLVWRLGPENHAFGLSPSAATPLLPAPFLVLPDARRLEEPRRAARVIAREVGHRLGLPDVDDPRNPMSALLRLDIPAPAWTPEQVLRLHESLKSIP